MGLRRKEEWEEDEKGGVERGSGEKKEERGGKEGKKKGKGQTYKSVRWLVIGITLYN